MITATFLTSAQIWGDKALGVLKKYGVAAVPSDLAVILGAYLGGSSYKDSAGHLSGAFWSASPSEDSNVRCAGNKGGKFWDYPTERRIGGRPALPQSSTSLIQPGKVKHTGKFVTKSLHAGLGKFVPTKFEIVEFGEYPQTAASDALAKELETLLNRRALAATGNKYTFDIEALDAYNNPFKGADYPEYVHAGKRYIRVIGKPYNNDSQTRDGRKVKSGEIYWVETQPIEWLADPTSVWVAREILFSGGRFNSNRKYDGDFSKTEINWFLQNCFVPQMLQHRGAADRNLSKGPDIATIAKVADRPQMTKLTDILSPSKGCFNCAYNIASVCDNKENKSIIQNINKGVTPDMLKKLLATDPNRLCLNHKIR